MREWKGGMPLAFLLGMAGAAAVLLVKALCE